MTMFVTNLKPQKSVKSTLKQGDNPEIETPEILDNGDTHKYQSFIGSLQWDIYLWVFDICTHENIYAPLCRVLCQE